MQIKKYAAILICVLVTASFAYAGSIKSANDFNYKSSGSNGNITGHVTVDILAAKGVSALTKWTKAKLAAKILASPVDEAVGAAGKGAKPLEGLPRVGSVLKTDGQHLIPDIVDNYAAGAQKFTIPTKGPGGQVVRTSNLYQTTGSLNRTDGIFEWIVDSAQVTHRRFILGGTVTGFPNQVLKP